MPKFCSAYLLLCLATWVSAAQPDELGFLTLGTAGGPDSNGLRGQPANVLLSGNAAWLIDAGDGAATSLAKTGIRITGLKGVLLSHLHFDHTGGMLAVLGLRMQLNASGPLDIYGPPGTRRFIEGLQAGMEPARAAAYGMPGQQWHDNLNIHEISDGDGFKLGRVQVTAVQNSHYASSINTGNSEGFVSLSFRFDTPERSIVYSGDTGPSAALTHLAQDADLLVIEMMDSPVVIANLLKANPAMNRAALNGLEQHFITHHLSPEQVATLAAAARVKSLVVTHFMPGADTPEQESHYRSLLQQHYGGPITFARDLEKY